MALEIQIGADSSDFDKKIKEVEKDIADLSKIKLERIKLGLDTREINANIKDAKKSLNDLKATVKDTGQSFATMQPKVANGGNALMQFSRIAQDAPFGIIGIGNNLTATAEAFSHLQKETGSTGGALKALAGSLMGSGGILLGISLVTTALTLFSQSGLKLSDVVDKMTGNFDQFKKSMAEANEEAAKTSSAQISSAKAYVSAAQNINLSMSDRLLAVKKLQDEYPAYFGNLSKEQILNGNVTGAVKELTRALIAKAKASAFSSKIADLAVEEFKLREKESEIIATIKKQYNEIAIAKATAASAGNQAATATNMAYGDAVDVLQSQRSTLKDVQDQIRNNAAEQAKWTSEINKSTAAAIKLEATAPKAIKPAGFTPQVAAIKTTIEPVGLAETAGMVLQIAKNVQGAEGMIATSMGNIANVFDSSGVRMLEALQQLNSDMNNLITTSIADTFGQLGTTIGEALASGTNVFSAIGNTLLQSLGKFLSDMGGLLIQYGTLAVVKGNLDLAIATGGPAAIVAGIAAIGVGIALKAVGGAIGAKAKGGASNSVSTGASVSSPTSSTGSSGGSSFAGGTVVFEISGQSLIGVLSNTLDKNKRLGGSLAI